MVAAQSRGQEKAKEEVEEEMSVTKAQEGGDEG